MAHTSSLNANLITQITDPAGRTYKYSYVSGPNGTELTQYTDPTGSVTTYGWDSQQHLTQITSAGGRITTIAYDSQDRVTSVTQVRYGMTGPTRTYAYNQGTSGCGTPPPGETVSDSTVETDPDGHTTKYCYDVRARVTTVIDANGHQQWLSYTPDNQPSTLTDGISQVTTLAYNTTNDITSLTEPALGSGQTPAAISLGYQTPTTGTGAVTGGTYLPSSETDPQGNCASYRYDAEGNPTDTYAGESVNCDTLSGGTAHVHTAYQGDSGMSCGAQPGEVCSQTDAKGNQTTYGYDSSGNLTSVTPPAPYLGKATIVPDSVSRTSNETDGKGQKTTYTYDTLDRTTQILYNGATSCSSSATCTKFTYDADGNLRTRVDNTGTTTYTYDNLSRLISEALPGGTDACAGTSPAAITWGYDAANNLTSQCDAGGITSYGYDPANNQTSETEPGGSCTGTVSLCTTFTYDANNRRTRTTYAGGATLNITYDNAGNETSVIGKNSTGSVLTSFSYTYVKTTKDTVLRQTASQADPTYSGTTSYSYDVLNRLTGASGGPSGTLSYGYDANGNRTSDNSGSYTYNAANQLTSSPGASSYSYDADGNLNPNSAGVSFSYNSKNQTTSITYNGTTLSGLTYSDVGQTQRTAAGSASYANGAQGILASTNGSTTTYYLRDASGSLLAERVGSSHYYYLQDGLGSVVAVITGTGAIENRYGYDPYGKSTSKVESIANPWQYTSGYVDSTGLYKFGARYYDPNRGAWTQPDPSRLLPVYGFSNSSPVNYTDPTGTTTLGVCVGGNAGFVVEGIFTACGVSDGYNTAITISYGGGFGYGVGAGVFGEGSNAASVENLAGGFFTGGGGIGEGAGYVYYGSGVGGGGLGLAAELPASGYLGYENTLVFPFMSTSGYL